MDMKKATILGICLAAAPLHAAATENADNDHLLDFSIEYSGEQVVGMTSYIYDYDTNNLVKEKIHKIISSSDPETFLNNTKEIFGYDSLQRQTLHEHYIWSDAVFDYIGEPATDARTVTTYDADGRIAQVDYYSWDESTVSWSINTRGIYTYSQDSGMETRYKNTNGTWHADPSERHSLVFNEQGWVIERMIYIYNFFAMGDPWMPTDLTRYDYDEHGNIILEETYMVSTEEDEGGGRWDDWESAMSNGIKSDISLALMYRYKFEYTYDEYGNILTKTESRWQDYLQDYELYSQIRYEHHYIQASDYLELPYIKTFAGNEDLSGFEIKDGNEDGKTWRIDNGNLRCDAASTDADPDILYLPALRLSSDFEISISLHSGVSDTTHPASVSVALCHNDENLTVSGYMADTLQIRNTGLQDNSLRFIPEKEGIYRIALCFDNRNQNSILLMDSIKIENARPSATPMPPYNLTAIPAKDGSLQVQLGWFAPIYTLDGDYIRAIDSMEVYRVGTERPIHTTGIMNSSLETRFVDQSAAEGLNTYRIFAYANGLRSEAAEISVIAGIAVASSPRNFLATENEDHSVLLSWNTPESAEGNVTYSIIRNNSVVVADGIKDTSFIDHVDIPLDQTYVFYAIYPFNEGGQGSGAVSELLFIGNSSPAPFKESFPGGVNTHQWMNEIVSGLDPAWGIGSNATSPAASSQDGDNGLASFLVRETAHIGDAVRFTSEKIDISTLKEPVLTFYLYHIDTEPTEAAVIVEASRNDGLFQNLSDTIRIGGASTEGWQKHSIELRPFAGEKNLRISFLGFSDLENCIHLDNITIDEETSAIAPANLHASVMEDSVTLRWDAEKGHTYHVIVNNMTTEEEVFNQSGIDYNAAEMILCLGNLEDGDYEWSVEANFEGSASNKVEGPAFKISTTSNQSENMAAVRAYPNPNQGDFWIELSGKSQVEIFSLHGQCLQTIENADGTIPVSIQTPGMYIVRINAGNQVSTTRIIVQ